MRVAGAISGREQSEFRSELRSPVDFPVNGLAAICSSIGIKSPVNAAIVPTGNEILRLLKLRYAEDLQVLPSLRPRRFETSIGFAKDAYDLSIISARELEGHRSFEGVPIFVSCRAKDRVSLSGWAEIRLTEM